MRNWTTKPAFYVARHGSTDRNDTNPPEYRGHDDVPLNEDGVQEAQDIANYLSYEKLGMICCSDLSRAIDTGEQLLPMSCVSYLDINPNLRPLDVGSFTGQPKSARNQKALKHYVDNPDLLIPGGTETVNQFRARNREAFSQYGCLSMSSPHPFVIICHTSNITALYGDCTPNSTLNPDEGDLVGPGGLIAVYMTGDQFELVPLLKIDQAHEGTPTAS